MVELSSRTSRWRSAPTPMDDTAKREALAWVRKLQASGGTDMVEGILEALRPVRKDAQRQVIVVTDGQIGFETQVIAAICDRLPAASRMHTVGVGSAVNRALTGPAARAGRGVEVILGLGEDPERAAQRLVARTSAPLVVDLQIAGSAVAEHAPRELALAAGGPRRSLDPEIERLGLDFQLATRLTSWIAVIREVTVDPRGGLRRERMPHELAYGLSAEGVGLRSEQEDDGSMPPQMEDSLLFAKSLSDADDAPYDGPIAGLKGAEDIVLAAFDLEKASMNAPAAPSAGPELPLPPLAAPPRAQQTIKVELSAEELPAARYRKTSNPALVLVSLIALGIGYWLTSSIGLAFAITLGVAVLFLLLRSFLGRRLG
jgi:hypothetical protein